MGSILAICGGKLLPVVFMVNMMVGLLAQEDDSQPSAEETLMLDLINRFREDPALEIERILLGIEVGVSGMGQNLDIAACREAVALLPKAPPLVFNLHLVQSARAHAQYMIASNITGHAETPGAAHFTGESPSVRMRQAGYSGNRMGENAFRNAVSVWNSHRGFIIDWGEGPGGMQDPAGHRLALASSSYREIGCAFVLFDDDDHGSTVHNLGNDPKPKRLIGGVIYQDLNRNDQYDVGEGLPDVELSVASAVAESATWKSGAFRIELTNYEANQLIIRYANKEYTESIPAGAENVYIRCRLPRLGDAIYMFKQMETFKLHLDAMTRAIAINMWLKTRGYYRSAADDALINEHCRAYADEFYADQALILPIYYQGKKTDFSQTLRAYRKKWLETDANGFFDDAETAFKIYAETKEIIDLIRDRKPIRKGRLDECVQDLIATQKRIHSASLRESLQVLEIMLTRSVAKKQ